MSSKLYCNTVKVLQYMENIAILGNIWEVLLFLQYCPYCSITKEVGKYCNSIRGKYCNYS